MKMKGNGFIRVTCGALTGVAAFCAVASTPAAAQTTLRLSTPMNQVDIRYSALTHFADLIDQKTGGSVKVQIFDSNTLHPTDKSFDAVIGGVSDISQFSGVGVDQRLPCARLTHFTPAAVDWERIVELDHDYNALLSDEFAKAGLITVLSMSFSYDQEWWFRDPPAHLDELDGRLVRDIGPITTHMIKKWGGEPVSIASTETYQAAERGVVDGINMGVATFSSWGMWKVMPHMINASLFYGNQMFSMNKKKFDALSADEQKAIVDAGAETEKWLKPRYESWINEQVGNAVMKLPGTTAVSLPQAERLRLIESAQEGWTDQWDDACGKDLADKVRALLQKYKG
jgi:TRAP-type C4-dicarboxylate transport system substrate-binding protein